MEIDTLFQTKTAKKPYLWRGTYLHSLYKGPPAAGGEKRVANYESRCETKKNECSLECVMILMILILTTLIFPLSVSLYDFHTHCFQLVCGTTLA